MINLLSEDAVKVSGARESRQNRVRDLDIEEAKLHPLQEMLGLEPDADVAGMLPDRAATDRAQTLAAEALEKGSVLASAEGRVSELADELAKIEARIAEDRSAGYNGPLGVAASQFGSLVVQNLPSGVAQNGRTCRHHRRTDLFRPSGRPQSPLA